MSGDDFIERAFFGIARPVGLLDTHEQMAECKPARILLSSRDNNLQGAGWKKSGWIAITPSRLSRLCRLFRGAGPITVAVNTRRLWLLVLLDSGFVTIREESICIEERACARCLLEPDCRWSNRFRWKKRT